MSQKYTDLIKLGTQYARRMNYLSNRIFGEVARTTNDKSMKVHPATIVFKKNPIIYLCFPGRSHVR